MHDSLNFSAHILCVGKEWFPEVSGGLNRYVYELSHQLTAGHDQVELCVAGASKPTSDASITLTHLTSSQERLPKRLWVARQQFAKRSIQFPDAINLHFALYSFPLLTQFPKQIPITFTFHGPWAAESQQEGQSQWGTAFKQWMEQQVYQRCDRFIVLSKAFGTILHETYDVPWEKIHIIPGGVNTTQFQPNLSRQMARDQLGWHCDRPILFTPRRLVQRMGINKLLTAMVQVKQQVPDVWLAIAGKGRLRETLEQQAHSLGLQDSVQFLGYLPDEQLPIAYQAADLTVVPSQSLEGFGLILVESLASGTPALCTPVGGMPEVVSALSPDLVTADASADAIAHQLTVLLTRQVQLPSRSDCREYACDRFDWTTIASRVRTVLLS